MNSNTSTTTLAHTFLTKLVSRNPIDSASPIYCEFPNSPANKTNGMWIGEPLNWVNWSTTSAENNRYVTVSAFYNGRRTKSNFACLLALMLDDIGPKVDQKEIKLEPTFKVETSPNNFQYWYILAEPITDFIEADELVQATVNRLKGLTIDNADPGSAGVTRYGRIPESINNKYEEIWQVQCTENDRFFSKQELINGLQLSFNEIRLPGAQTNFDPKGLDLLDRLTAWGDPVVQLIEAAGGFRQDRGHAIDILCPWIDEHSDAPETGSAILVLENGQIGFQCHHGHCIDRTLKDFHSKIKESGYMGWTLKNDFPVELGAEKEETPEGNSATLSQRCIELYQSGLSEAEIQELIPTLAEEYDVDFGTARRVAESIRNNQDELDRINDAKEGLASAIATEKLTISLKDYLPLDICNALEHLQISLDYAPEVVLTAFLTAFCGIQQTGMEIDIYQAEANFKQPLTLYAAMIASSGQKKSPLFNNIISLPMGPINREIKAKYRQELDLFELVEDKNREKPKKPTLIISAATIEGLLKRIENQPTKGILFFRDELAATFKSFNSYKSKGGDDEEVLIELYDGGSFETARSDANREIDIERSHLSVYGGIQEQVFKELLKGGDANGKFARFWFVHQPERPSFLSNSAGDGSKGQAVLAQLTRYYRWARNTPPVSYRFSDNAYETFRKAYNHFEELKVNEVNSLKAVWGKSGGRVARVAAILHQINCVYLGEHSEVIQPKYVHLANKLENLIISKSRQLYLGVNNSLPSKFQWVLSRLNDKGSVTARYLAQSSRRLDPDLKLKTSEAREIISALADQGYGVLKDNETLTTG